MNAISSRLTPALARAAAAFAVALTLASCGGGGVNPSPNVPDQGLIVVMQALTFVRSRLERAASGPDAPCAYACIQSTGELLPLPGESFDCMILSEVIEHLESPEVSIREAARVLRPGGRLMVTTPNYRSLSPVMEWLVDRSNKAPQMAGEQHISKFNPASLRRLLVDSRLGVENFGTIYNRSPFLSLLSQSSAEKQLLREVEQRSLLGMILVAVVVKPKQETH